VWVGGDILAGTDEFTAVVEGAGAFVGFFVEAAFVADLESGLMRCGIRWVGALLTM